MFTELQKWRVVPAEKRIVLSFSSCISSETLYLFNIAFTQPMNLDLYYYYETSGKATMPLRSSQMSEEDFLERRKEVERLLKKNSDWMWDWSSRPENIPPKEFLFKHPKRAGTLSMRNTSVMKKGGIFSAEFLKIFLPSLLLSHLLAIGLGIYIGKRLTITASSNSL
ncbi:BCL2/adenovirus E1B 19 kDa protein-interacting protein 3 isoform X2 [Pituophis catenifer annectens]|uniref:BCL2/adenovirus E1B 19 kDa protein-interacting protein 3 isoform X2 n=1 Tax=Pituophis catenifer annectens TaxID=94852 RepID=UPI003995A137